MFNYRENDRKRDYGLGGFDTLTLAQAREKAAACRAAVAEGHPPARAFASTKSVAFREAAERYMKIREPDWRSEKTSYKWHMFLERYGRSLAPLYCKDIRREDVEAALKPHWTRINHSARYFRSMIEMVLDYTTVKGWREGDNPARWKGNFEHELVRKKLPTKHNATIAVAAKALLQALFESLGFKSVAVQPTPDFQLRSQLGY